MRNRSFALPALLRELPVWLLFIFASSAAMMSVLKDPGRIVIGWTGDKLQFVYMVGRMIKAIRTGQPLLTDPHWNFPAGLPLTTADTPFLGVLLPAPIDWISSKSFVSIRRMGIRYLFLQPAYFDGGEHPSRQSIAASSASTPRLAAVARVDVYAIIEFLR
jgi:hypothetical protein